MLVNGDMGPTEVEQFCAIDTDGKDLMRTAVRQLELSARSYHRVLKLARTFTKWAQSDRRSGRRGGDPDRASGRGAAVSAKEWGVKLRSMRFGSGRKKLGEELSSQHDRLRHRLSAAQQWPRAMDLASWPRTIVI